MDDLSIENKIIKQKSIVKGSNKTALNLVIDIILLLLMMSITGIGFLIKYILVPGFRRNEMYGMGSDLYLWDMDRHQWAIIHLILALLFIALLLLHITLHWNMIKGIVKRTIPYKTARITLTVLLIVISVFMAVGPLFIIPTVKPAAAPHQGGGRHRRLGFYQESVNNGGNTDSEVKIIEIIRPNIQQ